jgi:hypothetical protein
MSQLATGSVGIPAERCAAVRSGFDANSVPANAAVAADANDSAADWAAGGALDVGLRSTIAAMTAAIIAIWKIRDAQRRHCDRLQLLRTITALHHLANSRCRTGMTCRKGKVAENACQRELLANQALLLTCLQQFIDEADQQRCFS